MDTSEGPTRLTVYIPTYRRYVQCLKQVSSIASLGRDAGIKTQIVVSINGDDTYDEEALKEAGASVVVLRGTDLGGNANICLGYEWLPSCDYLWILSDDDAVQEVGFARVMAEMVKGTDLIVASRSGNSLNLSLSGSERDLTRAGAAIDLISASICRSRCLEGLATIAFDRIATSYPHAGILVEAVRRGTIRSVSLLPLDQLVDDSLSIAAVDAPRAHAGQTQGVQFFGGALIQTLKYPTGFDGPSFNSWWARHWHRASMYRRAHSSQQVWVDRMARSSPVSLGWWLLSLPPYWRLKDAIRPRGRRA